MKKTTFRCVQSFLTIIALVLAAANGYGADKHPFSRDDYSALRRARATAISPDGKTILYLVTYDGVQGPEKREWWMIGISGENPHKLSLPEKFRPQGFSSDGRLR